MPDLISTTGLSEAIAKVGNLRTGIPDELALGMNEALLPIQEAMQTYGVQRSPANPKVLYIRGQGALYVPTNHQYYTSQQYGKTITSTVERSGSDILGTVGSPATYSPYLRGDLSGREQAWMHKGFWEPLTDIRDRLLPGIISRLSSRVQAFIDKVMGQ